MSFKKLSCLLFLLIFFSSCNEYEKLMGPALKIKLADSNPNPVFDGEVEPPIPNRSENDKTVLGIDSDINGIRDDVDIWINRTALDYIERMAMRQYAKAKQFWLKVCTENLKSEVKKAEDGMVNSDTCLQCLSDYRHGIKSYMIKKIDLMILNKSIRSCNVFYNQYSTVITAKYLGQGHRNCNFQIENQEQVIKSYREFGGYSI
jgi:hypothetical protein